LPPAGYGHRLGYESGADRLWPSQGVRRARVHQGDPSSPSHCCRPILGDDNEPRRGTPARPGRPGVAAARPRTADGGSVPVLPRPRRGDPPGRFRDVKRRRRTTLPGMRRGLGPWWHAWMKHPQPPPSTEAYSVVDPGPRSAQRLQQLPAPALGHCPDSDELRHLLAPNAQRGFLWKRLPQMKGVLGGGTQVLWCRQ